MNLKQTIKVLEEHNRWRRDNNVPAKTKMAEPKVLGMALDRAIEELNKLLIPNVNQQRELLIGLLTKLENGGGNAFIDKEQIVDDYLKAN